MSWTKVGSCPSCGAGIYVPKMWMGILPPPPHFTCDCTDAPKGTSYDPPRRMPRPRTAITKRNAVDLAREAQDLRAEYRKRLNTMWRIPPELRFERTR